MLHLWKKAFVVAIAFASLNAWAELDPDKKTVLITGANRGIGLEYVRQFSDRDWNIIATARKPDEAKKLQALAEADDNIVIVQLDVTDHARIEALGEQFKDQPIDILLSNAGITPRYKSAFQPVAGVDFDMARTSFEVNALGPLKLVQVFMDHVAASEDKKIVVISSKAGSFDESPKMPMMYSYRASKAALNMFMYALSFETQKRDVIVTLMSPGMVNTTPGFVNKNAMSPQESVTKMLAVIDGLNAESNGKFVDFSDGHVIGW